MDLKELYLKLEDAELDLSIYPCYKNKFIVESLKEMITIELNKVNNL